MTIAIRILFVLIFSISVAFAGNCDKHTALQAISCNVGYTWGVETKHCLQAPLA